MGLYPISGCRYFTFISSWEFCKTRKLFGLKVCGFVTLDALEGTYTASAALRLPADDEHRSLPRKYLHETLWNCRGGKWRYSSRIDETLRQDDFRFTLWRMCTHKVDPFPSANLKKLITSIYLLFSLVLNNFFYICGAEIAIMSKFYSMKYIKCTREMSTWKLIKTQTLHKFKSTSWASI